MARYSFRLPDIGEGIAEAEIVAWHVKIGERVEEDAQLADMMTDKATVEMESPVSGIVVQLAGEVGDLIPIGRSEEHTSELQSLMRISYAVFCLKTKKKHTYTKYSCIIRLYQ